MKTHFIKFIASTCVAIIPLALFGKDQNSKTKEVSRDSLIAITDAVENVKQTKLAFIENKGQWPSWVLYKADLPSGQAIVTKEGMMAGIYDQASLNAFSDYTLDMERYQQLNPNQRLFKQKPVTPSIKGHGWKIVFDNANAMSAQKISNKTRSQDYYNFLGESYGAGATFVHSYEEVSYENVYNNVDVRYYTAEGSLGLENDIIVKPGGDPSKIAMHIDGVDKVTLNESGALVLHTTVGDAIMPAPVTYSLDEQGRRIPVTASYSLNANHTIGFQLSGYDKTKKLIIDPVMLRWGTWVSANATTASHNHGIDLDKQGNIYVAGYYGSAGLITTGAFQTTDAGTYDCFFGKYTEPVTPGGTGSRLWQTYLGGTGADILLAIVVGTDSNVYATGYTGSTLATTYGTTGITPSWTNKPGANQPAMLIKVLSNGAGAVVRTLNGDQSTGSSSMTPYAIKTVLNANGSSDIVMTGYATFGSGYSGDGDFGAVTMPAGNAITISGSTTTAMAMRISMNFGTVSWRKLIAGASGTTSNMYCAAVDAANNIYLGGNTTVNANFSYNNPSTQTTSSNATEGLLIKLAPITGNVLWSRYFLSSSGVTNTTIRCMNVSRDNNGLFIGGITAGLATANITTGQTTYGGGASDLFAARLPLSGATTTWGTYLGGSGAETNMMGLNQDENNDIYILGYTPSNDFPIPTPLTTTRPIQGGNNGADDAIFVKLASNGSSVLYATYLGGSTTDTDPAGNNAVKFNNCRVYLAITSSSNNFPLTTGAVTTTKTSATSVVEPVLLSMANPPDFGTFGVAPASQTIACNTNPADYVASTPAYNVPAISRNGTSQTNGTTGAYPNGAPAASSYQWQRSIDQQVTWTNITNATTLTLTAAQMGTVVQNTDYRLVVNGDACNPPPMPIGFTTTTGAPTANPTVSCANGNGTFNTNAAGNGTLSYTWTFPAASTRTPPPNSASFTLTSIAETDAGFYSVTVTDAAGCKVTKTFSYNTSACRVVALPVILTSFDAEKDNSGTESLIKWTTASELNIDHYEVERSTDGKNYEVLGQVAAAGKSTVEQQYNFVDVAPAKGYNYYRLLIAETNGTRSYSQNRLLYFGDNSNGSLLLAYPNPAENQVTVSGFEAGSTIRMMNGEGRIVMSTESNGNTVQVDLKGYANGLYLLQVVRNNSVVKTIKVTVAR